MISRVKERVKSLAQRRFALLEFQGLEEWCSIGNSKYQIPNNKQITITEIRNNKPF